MVLRTDHLPEVLTPEQAAEYLQVSRETIYRYIHRGQLAAMKLGRVYRIPRDSLELLFCSTRARGDIPIRLYTDEELAEFIEADKIDEQTAEIIRRFEASIASHEGRSEPG
jgi:excisionase family DNA binding protein